MADAQTLRNLCDRLAPIGDLRYRVPFEIVAEIGCDHHRLLASKLGKKASTNLGAIHGDLRAVKLKLQAAVKIEPYRTIN